MLRRTGKNKTRLKALILTPILGCLVFSISACDAIHGILFADKIVKYNYETINVGSDVLSISKGKTQDNGQIVALEDRGILFNQQNNGIIKTISFNLESENYSSSYIYFSNNPLGFDERYPLNYGENIFNPLKERTYFVIQSESENIHLSNINIEHSGELPDETVTLPQINILTDNYAPVTSKTTYVNCKITTSGLGEKVNSAPAKIRVRGNSTSLRPKKPYRIKLNEKAPLFGYESAKNWVLLADFMDASRLHNYAALTFAKLVKGDEEFVNKPIHVNVMLNGENQGIYLFTEHIDETANRLNIKVKNVYEKSFDELPFYLERDDSDLTSKTGVESDDDYFEIGDDIYNLKYPKRDDFEEELDDGTINYHEEEFNRYFESLKQYIADLEQLFLNYKKDRSLYSQVAEVVDTLSLARYSVIDQFVYETSHDHRSFKFYKPVGEKIKFGPNWDYDSTSFAIPYRGYYVPDPYSREFKGNTYINEHWGHNLLHDTVNGRPLFKSVWNSLTEDQLDNFYQQVLSESKTISFSMKKDIEKWIDNNYCIAFDNTRYVFDYLKTQIKYFTSYYAS